MRPMKTSLSRRPFALTISGWVGALAITAGCATGAPTPARAAERAPVAAASVAPAVVVAPAEEAPAPQASELILPARCRKAPRPVERAPEGFPSEVKLPPKVPGAWLTRRETQRHADGRVEPVAAIYELRAQQIDTKKVRRHFERTLRRWTGGFSDTAEGPVGRFQRGDVSVEVRLDGAGGLRLVVRALPVCAAR